ncbi:MAG: hypothetical protein GXY07_04885 [Candidatus Hydrogenedentes bacterium]|jgi:hypothetical protein|nr:hypothetical protein [Candidatus Hydrogenedentota bacterium]
MKKYWKGGLLLLCGTLPFLAVYASRFLPAEEPGYEKALALLKEHSPEVPAELRALIPEYPGATATTATDVQGAFSIYSEVTDTAEQVFRFYAKELAALGWQATPCKEDEKKGACYTRGSVEVYVYTTPSLFSAARTGVVLYIEDAARQFHPSKENDPAAETIITAVAETYRTCTTYRDECYEVMRFHNSGSGVAFIDTIREYKTAFVRPAQFRLSVQDSMHKSFGSTKVIHADGYGIREYEHGEVSELESLPDSLEYMQQGVPRLLFSEELLAPLNLSELEHPEEEVVDGVSCHRIRGKDAYGQEVTLWIDKNQTLIKQVKRTEKVNIDLTEITATWKAQVDVPIEAEELAFRPFGRIPIPIGLTLRDFQATWHWTPLWIKIAYLTGGSLLLAGILAILLTWRRVRRERPVTVADTTVG